MYITDTLDEDLDDSTLTVYNEPEKTVNYAVFSIKILIFSMRKWYNFVNKNSLTVMHPQGACLSNEKTYQKYQIFLRGSTPYTLRWNVHFSTILPKADHEITSLASHFLEYQNSPVSFRRAFSDHNFYFGKGAKVYFRYPGNYMDLSKTRLFVSSMTLEKWAFSPFFQDEGTYDPNTRTITWLIGEVQPKEKGSMNFSINVREDAQDKAEVINFATVHFSSVPEVTRTNGVVNTITTALDTIPPETTISISPSPNQAGWNKTDVTINLTATDDPKGLGVKEIHYRLTGAVTREEIVPGDTAQIYLSTEGTATLTYWAVDNAGNVETSKSLEIKIDKTPPTISAQASPEPNLAGWNNTDVSITFIANDNLSGIASVDEPIIVTSEGKDQYIGGVAVDFADNQATTSVVLNIDKTPPQTSPQINPSPNQYNWNNTLPVNVIFSAIDNLSGIASTTEPTSLTTEGIHTITYYSTDIAGNIEPEKTLTINIDTTPPQTEYSLSETPNEHGWINQLPVTITFSATDPQLADGNPPSGVSFTTEDITINEEGIHTIDYYSKDFADNTEEIKTITVKIDTTPPEITAEFIPLDVEEDEGLFKISYSAFDTYDPNPKTTAALKACRRNIPVTNGQKVEIESDDDCEIEREGRILKIEAPKVTLEVTSVDIAGNVGEITVKPEFRPEDEEEGEKDRRRWRRKKGIEDEEEEEASEENED